MTTYGNNTQKALEGAEIQAQYAPEAPSFPPPTTLQVTPAFSTGRWRPTLAWVQALPCWRRGTADALKEPQPNDALGREGCSTTEIARFGDRSEARW
jgi:hypothetical protein